MTGSQHVYEVRPRKDRRGVYLISDVLPFGRLSYGDPEAISNAVNCWRLVLWGIRPSVSSADLPANLTSWEVRRVHVGIG
jgi:hypothetical protein